MMVGIGKKKLEFKGISVSLFGVQLGFEFGSKNEQKENLNHTEVEQGRENKNREEIIKCLKELYIIRNNLSYFYFTYNNLEQLLFADYDDEEELEFHLMNKCYSQALKVYRNIADILMGSDYFLLVKSEKRKQIIESFDYVMLQQTLMEHDEDYEILIDEQREISEDLIALYENIDNQIDEFNSMLSNN